MNDQEFETEDAIAAAIDGAEEVRDSLDGLVERAATDPGAPFAPEVVEQLADLKKDDRAAFESLRAQLKGAGCRVTELDKLLTDESDDQENCAPKQADILIGLVADAELFHASDGTGYADLEINGHRETWPIRNKGFRRWLARQFFEATAKAPNSEALHSASTSLRRKHISTGRSGRSSSASAGTMANCTSISAMRAGGRWRSMRRAGT
jgi:hypothetical protein